MVIQAGSKRESSRELIFDALSSGLLSIADASKAIRAAEGLSQQEFAELVGLSPRVIKDLERGKGNPRLDSLEKIAQAIGLEVVFAKPRARVSLLDAKHHREAEEAARAQYFHQADASPRAARKVHESNAVSFKGVSYRLPSISK